MSDYQGDFTAGKTVRVFFNTQDTTGAPITLASGAISVYKDGGTTETTTGVTLTTDFDSRTGLHLVAVDTSADGTFYSGGSDFEVVITAGTVNSISVVGKSVAKFSLSNRSALRPTTADRTLDVTATGEAGIDWANIGSPTTTVNLSGTTVKTATDVETDTADIQSRLPAALVSGRMDSYIGATAASLTFNLTGSITGNLSGSVGSVTGNVGGNVIGSVGSVAAGGITASSIATGAIDADALATDAVGEIADGVWDEALAGHLGAGSTGAALNAAGAAGDPWSTTLPGAYGAGTAGYIVGTNIDALISSRLAPTVAGRTLDITAGGTAGVDWGNVENQSTVVNLSATNIDVDQVVASVSGSVGSIGADGVTASSLATDAVNEIADGILNRDFASVSDTNSRTLLNAARFLRNKWSVSGGTLTVTAENDTTTAWTATISTDAAAIPIVGSDPA